MRYLTCKYYSDLETMGYGSLKVIENYIIQSGTHDFLLTFYSNHRPISHRFRDKRRYPSKIANFPHPRVFLAPTEGFPLEFGIGARVPNASMMGLPEGRKSFKIGLVVLIQYWWQPPRVVFARRGTGGHVPFTELRGMALNGLFCADVLWPLDLVPLTDFTYKYHSAATHPASHVAVAKTPLTTSRGLKKTKKMNVKKPLKPGNWWKVNAFPGMKMK